MNKSTMLAMNNQLSARLDEIATMLEETQAYAKSRGEEYKELGVYVELGTAYGRITAAAAQLRAANEVYLKP